MWVYFWPLYCVLLIYLPLFLPTSHRKDIYIWKDIKFPVCVRCVTFVNMVHPILFRFKKFDIKNIKMTGINFITEYITKDMNKELFSGLFKINKFHTNVILE